MLVLSRKPDERIVFDLSGVDFNSIPQEDRRIEVTIVEVRGDKVRLGIVAPKQIPCHRQEVQEAINRQGGSPRRLRQPAH